MKKTLSILTLSLLSAASIMAAPISPEEALRRLNNSGEELPATRALLEMPKLRMTLDANNGDAALYVFENDSEKGFMILSADDMLPPLLGYSDSNNFDSDNLPPALQGWLKQYAEQIEYARSVGVTLSSSPTTRVNLPSSWTPIQPLLKTTWNQDAPYNQDCPIVNNEPCFTGCVATSMAQVMKYHEYPVKGQGSISYNCTSINKTLDLDFSTITFNWSGMINNYNDSYTPVQAGAVAALMKAAGYSVKMSYGTDSSGAISAYIPGALVKYFNYDPSVTYVSRSMKDYTDWATLIYDNLKNIGPVIYDGDTDFSGGHSFVCDGYQGNGYFHFNWGWGGTGDGYYLLDSLSPAAVGIGGALGGFNFNQDIVINIQPLKQGSKPQDQIVLSGSLRGDLSGVSYINMEPYGDQYSGVRYYGLSEMTFDLGAKFEPENNSSGAFFLECANNASFRKYYMPIDPGSILYSDGSSQYPYPTYTTSSLKSRLDNNVKYKVSIAYRPDNGEWTVMPAGVGDYNYFYITRNGDNFSFDNIPQAQFTCDALTLESPLYDGNAAEFKVKITNGTTFELTRGVTLLLLDASGNPAYTGDSFLITLSPGQSFNKDWTSELSRNVSGILTKPTNFYMALYDIGTQTIYYTDKTPVSMLGNPGNPDFDTTMTLDNATYDEDKKIYLFDTSTNMKVSTTIEVTKGYFTYPVTIHVLEDYKGNELAVDYSIQMDLAIIEKGESKTFTTTLDLPTLTPDKKYYMGVTINNQGKLEIPEMPFMVLSNESGIESIEADASALKFFHDKASGFLYVIGDVEKVEVYSLNGVKLASSSENCIDITSLGKGVVIATATSRKGERSSIKLAL